MVAHRRAGKTVASVMDLVDAALRNAGKSPRYAYVAPTYTQAKDVAWSYLKEYTARLPGTVANESELRVDMPGDRRIRLYGADNYDRMRGLYFDGVILDEYADMDPRAWPEVIRPTLSDRKGWGVFIGTPKGQNAFWQLWESAADDPDWFRLMLRASATGIISEEELADARKTMTSDQYEQEYECSFEAANPGAYYAASLRKAEAEGRVGFFAPDPLMAIRLFFDIGGTGATADATSIWVAQYIGQEIRVLDYYEAQHQPLASHLAWLRGRGYTPDVASVWLPHDGRKGEAVYDVTYASAVRDAGYDVTVVENQGRGAAMERVNVMRRLFPRIRFNADTTKAGRDALLWYHEKIDEVRRVGLGPLHDWSSHAADAFGLMGIVYEEVPTRPKPLPQVEDTAWAV